MTNRLSDDGALTRQAAHALAADARTKDIPLGYKVTCCFGYVGVVGLLTEAQRNAVTEVCKAINGVRGVKVVTTS